MIPFCIFLWALFTGHPWVAFFAFLWWIND